MKVLVVRFSSIGDIVLTSPVVRCLKKQKKAEIHFLTKTVYKPVVEGNPCIDRIHTIKKDIPEILPDLKRESFDLIIDLHHNLRTFRLKSRLAVPSASFPKLNLEKWLLTRFKINKLPDRHIVERYFETVKDLGVVNDGEGLDYFVPPSEEVVMDGKAFNGIRSGQFIAFAIGGKFQTKKLPVEIMAELCQKISEPVILLGGNEDRQVGAQVAEAGGKHIYNACGSLTINGSASVIRQSKKVITHDTGMMHIAAAFLKPVISIWGNTVPAFGMTPYFGKYSKQNIIVEVNGLKCRPCSKIGYRQCPESHFRCMKDIDLRQILENL